MKSSQWKESSQFSFLKYNIKCSHTLVSEKFLQIKNIMICSIFMSSTELIQVRKTSYHYVFQFHVQHICSMNILLPIIVVV